MKTVKDNPEITNCQRIEENGLGTVPCHAQKRFHKFRSRYYSHKMMNTGWALRSLTAAILMVLMVLAPVSMTRSLAAPASDPQDSMGTGTVIGEIADMRSSRGDSRLTKRQRAQLLAWELLGRADGAEPLVTADMKALEQGSTRLQGLEYRIKGEDSLVRKILADADAAGEIDWAVSVDSTINRAHQHGTNRYFSGLFGSLRQLHGVAHPLFILLLLHRLLHSPSRLRRYYAQPQRSCLCRPAAPMQPPTWRRKGRTKK